MVHHQAVPVQIGKEIEKTTRKKVYDLVLSLIPPILLSPKLCVHAKTRILTTEHIELLLRPSNYLHLALLRLRVCVKFIKRK